MKLERNGVSGCGLIAEGGTIGIRFFGMERRETRDMLRKTFLRKETSGRIVPQERFSPPIRSRFIIRCFFNRLIYKGIPVFNPPFPRPVPGAARLDDSRVGGYPLRSAGFIPLLSAHSRRKVCSEYCPLLLWLVS